MYAENEEYKLWIRVHKTEVWSWGVSNTNAGIYTEDRVSLSHSLGVRYKDTSCDVSLSNDVSQLDTPMVIIQQEGIRML